MPSARERWRARLPAWTLRLGLLASVIWVVADHLRSRVRAARIQAAQERQRHEGLRAHFSSTLSDVSFTVYSLLPTLFDQISSTHDVERAFAQLRDRSSQRGGAGESITDSQQLSAVSDETGEGSRENPSTGTGTAATSKSASPDGRNRGHALPDSWASEFVAQGAGDSGLVAPGADGATNERGTSEHHDALHHLQPDETAAPSTDADSMAISSPSQTLSLSINSHSPPSASGASSAHSPPLLQSPSVSPRTRYATLGAGHGGPGEQAQHAQEHQPSKSKLWNEVKTGAIARAMLAIHIVPLVVLHTTAQLCMMARKQYLAEQAHAARASEAREREADRAGRWFLPWSYFSVAGMGLGEVDGGGRAEGEADQSGDAGDNDEGQLDRVFLCSSWWLLHIGWRMIEDKVQAAVHAECRDLKLKQSMTVGDWRALFVRLRARLAVDLAQGEPSNLLQDALIPPLGTDRFATLLSAHPEVATQCPLPAGPPPPALLALLDEMAAQVRSPDYPLVLAGSMDLLDMDLCATLADEAYAGSVVQTTRLAAALPSVASWSRDLGNGYPEKALDRLLASGDVAAYAALVYGDFSNGRRV